MPNYEYNYTDATVQQNTEHKIMMQKYGSFSGIPEHELTRDVIIADLNLIKSRVRGRNMYKLFWFEWTSDTDTNHSALKYMPQSMITEEYAKLAVRQDHRAMQYIPEHLLSEELVLYMFSNGWPDVKRCANNDSQLEYVPVSLMTDRVLRVAMNTINHDALKHVPVDMITHELAKYAVSKNGEAIMYVPKTVMSNDIIKIAVDNCASSFEHIPVELLTNDIIMMAVSKRGMNLKYVPENLMTDAIIKTAVKNKGYCSKETNKNYIYMRINHALQFVPKSMMTLEIAEIAVSNFGLSLAFVPDKFATKKIKHLAVQNNDDVFYILNVTHNTKDTGDDSNREMTQNLDPIQNKIIKYSY